MYTNKDKDAARGASHGSSEIFEKVTRNPIQEPLVLEFSAPCSMEGHLGSYINSKLVADFDTKEALSNSAIKQIYCHINLNHCPSDVG